MRFSLRRQTAEAGNSPCLKNARDALPCVARRARSVLTEATQECVLPDVLTEPTDGGRSERADGGDPEHCQERVLTEATQKCVLLDVLTKPRQLTLEFILEHAFEFTLELPLEFTFEFTLELTPEATLSNKVKNNYTKSETVRTN